MVITPSKCIVYRRKAFTEGPAAWIAKKGEVVQKMNLPNNYYI
jgi:hypothetical protein